jgi:D-3-phosphoglycerate dehydrogenase
MNITILDDYQNMVKTLAAFSKAAGHNVTIWNDHTKNVDVLAERLKDTEALALIRERTPIQSRCSRAFPNSASSARSAPIRTSTRMHARATA